MLSSNPRLSVTSPSSKPIDTLTFHPTSSSLLAASSGQIVSIYNVDAQSATPAYEIDATSPIWSLQWSGDGKLLSTTSRDGKLRLWDIRADSKQSIAVRLSSSSEIPCFLSRTRS